MEGNIFYSGPKPTVVKGFVVANPAGVEIISEATVDGKKVEFIHIEFSPTLIESGHVRLVEGDGNADIMMGWSINQGIMIPYKRAETTAGNAVKIICNHGSGINYEIHYRLKT